MIVNFESLSVSLWVEYTSGDVLAFEACLFLKTYLSKWLGTTRVILRYNGLLVIEDRQSYYSFCVRLPRGEIRTSAMTRRATITSGSFTLDITDLMIAVKRAANKKSPMLYSNVKDYGNGKCFTCDKYHAESKNALTF